MIDGPQCVGVCFFVEWLSLCTSLFISKVRTGNWLPATSFHRRWCVDTSRSSGGADELSNVTRRMWPHGFQVVFSFCIESISHLKQSPPPLFRILHLSGGCFWLNSSGVRWQAGSGADQVSDTPGRRWRAKDSCAARSWWWATRSVARRRYSTSLLRTRILR